MKYNDELAQEIRAILAVACILAYVVIGYISIWGKPYAFVLVTYIPWYGWLLLIVGVALILWDRIACLQRRGDN